MDLIRFPVRGWNFFFTLSYREGRTVYYSKCEVTARGFRLQGQSVQRDEKWVHGELTISKGNICVFNSLKPSRYFTYYQA